MPNEILPWEDALLERKLESDLNDLLKTLVAFANSVRPDHTAVILIGERDDGAVQGVTNPDAIQKRVRRECDKIYPPIPWRSRVYEKDGKPCVRVEIEFSGDTPHFGGSAWVRHGSVTIVRELAKWLDKEILVAGDEGTVDYRERHLSGHPRWSGTRKATLRFFNNFWATFFVEGRTVSEPIEKLILSWDEQSKCLKVLVKL